MLIFIIAFSTTANTSLAGLLWKDVEDNSRVSGCIVLVKGGCVDEDCGSVTRRSIALMHMAEDVKARSDPTLYLCQQVDTSPVLLPRVFVSFITTAQRGSMSDQDINIGRYLSPFLTKWWPSWQIEGPIIEFRLVR
mmetsp:Transcript_48561/g.140707  ORF Transcript_48561/g.140707 Transcript_48561/m.140707 type:complete len:136 (+) Transcript_48561:65-472(+)